MLINFFLPLPRHPNNMNSFFLIADNNAKIMQYVIWMYIKDVRRAYRIFVDVITPSVEVECYLSSIVLPINYQYMVRGRMKFRTH